MKTKRKTDAAARKEAREGEALFATINDPEGMLAGDLCSLLFSRCRADAEKRAVEGRPDAFLVSIVKIDAYYRNFYLPDVLPEWFREVTEWTYPDPVPLGFDPERISDPQLRRIWRDPLTRALWTGLRWRRLVSDKFNDSVEAAADYIRLLQRKEKFNRQELNRLFWRMNCFGSSELTGSRAASLWPYLTGERVFRYTVEEKKGS
jgi:hypothetical protein